MMIKTMSEIKLLFKTNMTILGRGGESAVYSYI